MILPSVVFESGERVRESFGWNPGLGKHQMQRHIQSLRKWVCMYIHFLRLARLCMNVCMYVWDMNDVPPHNGCARM